GRRFRVRTSPRKDSAGNRREGCPGGLGKEGAMRSVVLCLGAAVISFGASFASAEGPETAPKPSTPKVRIEVPQVKHATRTRQPMTEAQQVIYERAAARAHEREARLEARNWQGYSPLRPTYHAGYHYNNGAY